jgi:hypothetical protein
VDGIDASRRPRAGYLLALSTSSANNSTASRAVLAKCPAGKSAIGGGALVDTIATGGPALIGSRPELTDGWYAFAVETSSYVGNWQLWAYAVCANVAP